MKNTKRTSVGKNLYKKVKWYAYAFHNKNNQWHFTVAYEQVGEEKLTRDDKKALNAVRLGYLKEIASKNPSIDLVCDYNNNDTEETGKFYRQYGFKVDDYYPKDSRETLQNIAEHMANTLNEECQVSFSLLTNYVKETELKAISRQRYARLKTEYIRQLKQGTPKFTPKNDVPVHEKPAYLETIKF